MVTEGILPCSAWRTFYPRTLDTFNIGNDTAGVQNKIFSKTFEKLGQYRRIKVLEGFECIGEELKQQFETIRLKRNKYLHFWSGEQENVEEDARTAFGAAVHLVAKTIGQEIVDGNMLKLNPTFEKYLDKQGLIQ
ncbi:MAG: hypothetical protein V3V51_08685, partial [Desulfobacterales bacterium]